MQRCLIWQLTAITALKNPMLYAGIVMGRIMTKPKFDLSPECIVNLCPDLPSYSRNMLVDQLEWAWDESEDFEVEIEVPMWEEPYAYFLRVKVVPLDERFTIERSLT